MTHSHATSQRILKVTTASRPFPAGTPRGATGSRQRDEGLKDYLVSLGASTAVPGGGSASALAGAMGAALGKMATGITLNKIAPNCRGKIKRSLKQFHHNFLLLLDLSEKDSRAYEKVLAAYKLSKRAHLKAAKRNRKIQSALTEAMIVPFKAMKICVNNLILLCTIAPAVKQNIKSDFGVGVLLTQTAIKGCLMNVNINLTGIKDSSIRNKTAREVRLLEEMTSTLSRKLERYLCD